MSALIGHAKAARILAAEFSDQASEARYNKEPDIVSTILLRIGIAYSDASEMMEQAMREEATGLAGSLDA